MGTKPERSAQKKYLCIVVKYDTDIPVSVIFDLIKSPPKYNFFKSKMFFNL